MISYRASHPGAVSENACLLFKCKAKEKAIVESPPRRASRPRPGPRPACAPMGMHVRCAEKRAHTRGRASFWVTRVMIRRGARGPPLGRGLRLRHLVAVWPRQLPVQRLRPRAWGVQRLSRAPEHSVLRSRLSNVCMWICYIDISTVATHCDAFVQFSATRQPS